jgi:hypothetical protein
LLPFWNESNAVWSVHITAVSDPELLTHHAGWALTTCYSQHVSSLLKEIIAIGTHLRICLMEYAGQAEAQNCIVKNIQKGNRELLQKKPALRYATRS